MVYEFERMQVITTSQNGIYKWSELDHQSPKSISSQIQLNKIQEIFSKTHFVRLIFSSNLAKTIKTFS